MPDPHLTFNREELTITLTGLGGGWSLGQLGELSLLNSAQLQFPSMWNDYKTSVAMQIIETQWRLGARLVLTQTLEAGVDYTSRDGVSSSMSLENDLKLHILDRPTTQIDLTATFKLEGTFDGHVYEGSGEVGLGLRATF